MPDGLQKAIAALEVLGGALGILTVVWLLVQGPNLGLLVVGIAFLALFIASVVAGLWLWRGDPRGLPLSTVVQAVQVPVVSSSLVYYAYSLVGLLVTVSGALSFEGELHLWSSGSLVVGAPVTEWRIGVNVVALAALAVLVHARRTLPHSLPERAGAV